MSLPTWDEPTRPGMAKPSKGGSHLGRSLIERFGELWRARLTIGEA